MRCMTRLVPGCRLTTQSATRVRPRKTITLVPWMRATSGTARSSRVAFNLALSPASPECGPAPVTTVPVTSTTDAASTSSRPSHIVVGSSAGWLRVSSEIPARWYSTMASPSSTTERRK